MGGTTQFHQRFEMCGFNGGLNCLSSHNNRFLIVTGGHQLVRFVSRGCVTCRRVAAKPNPQLLGQLPSERITPGPVFDKVGVDYGHVRKPVIVKAYICVFISLTVKAVHLEFVSELTTEAFIAALRRFIARRGKPTLIWSDKDDQVQGRGCHMLLNNSR